jgi:virulence factor Mce-like protein
MRRSIASNPVLIGSITLLVVIVAVFLSYNANTGLPFVPTTQLKVRVANGANLVKGNEVRSGGSRIGVIGDMAPVRLADGTTGAELTLKLDKKIGSIPKDTTFRVRPRSALGLKYLELTMGHSRTAFKDGDTVPASQATYATDIDRIFGMFDDKTRRASQENLMGFGDAFAGRGQALGRTIESLPPLFGHLQPVMATLGAPNTDLHGFVQSLADAARIVAPVSKQQAALFTSMADTFQAIGRDPQALKDFIAKSPSTLDTSIASFRVQRPFLDDLTTFGHDFAPATAALHDALPSLDRALEVGTPVQQRSGQLNDQLAKTFDSVKHLAEAPGTNAALRGITATMDTLNPQLRFYGPYVTVCNGPNYFFTYLAEHFSELDSTGSSQRALLNFAGHQDNSVGSMEAKRPANGENVKGDGAAQYGHDQPYGAAVDSHGNADCEAGQRGYIGRSARFFPKDLRIARDPRTPGLQGPTFTGLAKVPPGETFTARPETGPYATMPASETGEK